MIAVTLRLTNTVCFQISGPMTSLVARKTPCPDAITHLFPPPDAGPDGSFVAIGSDLDMSEANYKLMNLT